jgi:predicted TIM-barrel fold metal-dependent hydrolase/RimJ/RimL family protein N-acetyltransferase
VILDAEVYLGPNLFGPSYDFEALVSALDAAGVARAVICPARPPDYHLGPANDAVADAVRRAPNRLIGFARVDPRQGAAAVAELHRSVEQLGLRGLMLHPWEELFPINDRLVDPLVAHARERRIPVQIAGGFPLVSHAAQIADLARRFPDVPILAAHGGQINISGRGLYEAGQMLRACANVLLQTSGVYREDWIEDMARDIGASRIVFGSGAPYYDLGFELERIRRLHLPAADRDAIAGANLARLLGTVRAGTRDSVEGASAPRSQGRPALSSVPETDIPGELRGPRVLLRPLDVHDAAAVWEAIQESRAHLESWLPWVRALRSVEDERTDIARMRARWLRHEDLTVGIFEGTTGRYLGGSGLHRIRWDLRIFEIGYWIRVSAEGYGYVTETVQLLTRLAFDCLQANRVEIYVDPRNTRSARVPERLGYVLEGTLRHFRIGVDGRPEDRHVFALIRSDYLRLPWREDRRIG